MNKKTYISLQEFCLKYQTDEHFVRALEEYDLLKISKIDDQFLIHHEHIASLERYVHLHYELEINPEGIQAIVNLLNRISELQTEIRMLKKRLNRLEDY